MTVSSIELDNSFHKFCDIHISAYGSELNGNEKVGSPLLTLPDLHNFISTLFLGILSFILMGSHLRDVGTCMCLDFELLDKININRVFRNIN